jgi:class 3 adenylate cyclase
VHAFGGEVLKFIGDGVLAIFPSLARRPKSARRRCAPSPPPRTTLNRKLAGR